MCSYTREILYKDFFVLLLRKLLFSVFICLTKSMYNWSEMHWDFFSPHGQSNVHIYSEINAIVTQQLQCYKARNRCVFLVLSLFIQVSIPFITVWKSSFLDTHVLFMFFAVLIKACLHFNKPYYFATLLHFHFVAFKLYVHWLLPKLHVFVSTYSVVSS